MQAGRLPNSSRSRSDEFLSPVPCAAGTGAPTGADCVSGCLTPRLQPALNAQRSALFELGDPVLDGILNQRPEPA